MEKRRKCPEVHVILIGQDNARDCLITNRDVPRGPEMDLGCHEYDSSTFPDGSSKEFHEIVHCTIS